MIFERNTAFHWSYNLISSQAIWNMHSRGLILISDLLTSAPEKFLSVLAQNLRFECIREWHGLDTECVIRGKRKSDNSRNIVKNSLRNVIRNVFKVQLKFSSEAVGRRVVSLVEKICDFDENWSEVTDFRVSG